MEIIYMDRSVIVCVKPAGVLSTDEEGGLPSLLRKELGDDCGRIRTVHRLDRVVSGLMVLARTARSAAELSRQMREDRFGKEYLAVVHGATADSGEFTDLLCRDKAERKSYVTQQPGKDVQQARLQYATLGRTASLSMVRVHLLTGRTHQIRCQFSHHGFPLVGDKKYGQGEACPIALWSEQLAFFHPYTGEPLHFSLQPPAIEPWTAFEG